MGTCRSSSVVKEEKTLEVCKMFLSNYHFIDITFVFQDFQLKCMLREYMSTILQNNPLGKRLDVV